MELSNHHIHRYAFILLLAASLSACDRLRVELQQTIDRGPSDTPIFTTTPYPEPVPTCSPRPTLAYLALDAMIPITTQNIDQLAVLDRFEIMDADSFAWAQNNRGLFYRIDNTIHGFNLQSREEATAILRVPEGAKIQFCSAQSLMMASFDETQRKDGYEVQIWDLETGQLEHTFTREDRTIKVTSHPRFSQDCSMVVVASSGSPVYPSLFEVFDLASGSKIYQTTDPYPIARDAAAHGPSQQLATGTGAGIFLWGLGGIEPWGEISPEVSDGRIDGFDPQGRTLALPAVGPPQVELWDLQEMQPFARFEGSFAGFSPDGAWLVTSDVDGFTLWDIGSGEPLMEFPTAASVRISPDQSMLLVAYGPGSYEDIVEVWGVPSE